MKKMVSRKIKKGDNVQILIGKDNGKTGVVDRVLSKKGRVLVSGLNLYKRHVKKQGQIDGGVIEIVKSIDLSNVAVVCPNCKKASRIGFTISGNEKVRICKRCKKDLTVKVTRGK